MAQGGVSACLSGLRGMRPPGRADACAACAHMHVESVLVETELPERIADDREELPVTRLLPAAARRARWWCLVR